MARDRSDGESQPVTSGGDDPWALYDELTDDLLYDPTVGRATMMGFPCVRLAGRFFAGYDKRDGTLVVKLPQERVTALIQSGIGDVFAPNGRTFREWVSASTVERKLWARLLSEAVDFARKGLAD